MRRTGLLLCALGLAVLSCNASEAEITPVFDLSEIEGEIERKPYAVHGFLEAQPTLSGFDRDSPLYRLRYYGDDPGRTSEQLDLGVRLEGDLHYRTLSAFARLDSIFAHDHDGWEDEMTLMEGYLSFKPGPHMAVDAGKRVTRWGTGYAWNPVSFVDRPKDPEDPEESLEGYSIFGGDFIWSFGGPLQTLAFTPVLLPVARDINEEFGQTGHVNAAAKLYALFWDTDVDLLVFEGASRTTRWGADFSRNFRSNLEVHGEIAWIEDARKMTVLEDGRISTHECDVSSYLLGMRYLTETDLTAILEYYHNGTGVDPGDLKRLYVEIDHAYDAYNQAGDRSLFDPINALAADGFSWRNPLKDYLYVRLSQKEPFDVLYFTPALTAIVAMNDGSFSLMPEFNYSPITNLDLRIRGIYAMGRDETEYGGKQTDWQMELRLRYFF
jgi:hypothetical protein